jgi:hypothetical protein
MASRPPDFKASGVRAERIIASGSDTNPKLYIIGKDAAGNDGITVDTNDLILSGDGTDSWLFISGGIGNNNRVTFGGDVYISGSLSGGAAGSDKEVQFNKLGSFSGSSGFKYDYSTQTLIVANLTVTGTSTVITSSNLVISDPIVYLASGSKTSNQNGGIAIASGSSITNQALVFGRVANDTWGVGRQDVTGGTATSLTTMTHVPLRASAIQLGGTVAVITSSDGTTVIVSGSGVQVKGDNSSGVKFYESGAEYLKFTMNAGSSALIASTESAYPSLYLSGQAVHLDSSDGLTWFGRYSSERLAIDHTDSSSPKIVSRFPSGQSVNLVISGSQVAIGSNAGTTTFTRGTTGFLKVGYNGANDVTVDGSPYVTTLGSQNITAVSGSSVTLNTTNGVNLQKDGATYININNNRIFTDLSASNSIYVKPGMSGSLYVSGTLITNNITGSNMLLSGDIAVNGGDITTTATTFNLVNATATTVNIAGGASTATNIGNASGLTTIAGDIRISGNDIQSSTGATALSFIGPSVTVGGDLQVFGNNIKGSAGLTAMTISSTDVSVVGDLAVNGGDLTTNQTTFNVINSTATTVNFGGGATNRINIGNSSGQTWISGSARFPQGLSGSLTRLTDGSAYIVAGPNITINTGSNGSIEITGSAGGGGGPSGPFTEASNIAAYTTSSIAIGLGAISSTQGSDVSFFVSGSIGSAPSRASSGLSLFGGDVLTSGSIHLVTGSYQSSVSLIGTATSASLEIRNMTLGGGVLHSVKTSTNNTVNFLEVLPNGSQENTKIALMRSAYAGSTATNPYKATDTNFFVGGLAGSKGGSTGGTSVFGGDLMISGSSYVGTSTSDKLNVRASLASSIIPDADRVYDLGTSTLRFANIYTGDLHLKNDRGDYTLIEEEDCLTIRFNKTGKRYKFLLESVPQYDEDPIVR